MEVPRRNFLKTGALTALTAGVAISSAQSVLSQDPGRVRRVTGPTTNFEIPLRAQLDVLYGFTHGTFAPYVGDIFEGLGVRGQTVGLKLVAANEFKPNLRSQVSPKMVDRSDSFSLTFYADEKLSNVSSIHKLSHPALGKFDVFMTHRQAEDGTQVYEAVFNRLH
jgi:hypothetical protein